jgi:hypothetical protein
MTDGAAPSLVFDLLVETLLGKRLSGDNPSGVNRIITVAAAKRLSFENPVWHVYISRTLFLLKE